MSIPLFSEFTIRRHANAKSFQKGEAYYDVGAVISVTQRGKLFQAEVEGSQAQIYHVNISLKDDGLTLGRCTCPYHLEGWCKHIVATMLVCVRHPEIIEQRPSLEELINRLDYIQTQKLLRELVAEYPQILEAIDQQVSWMTNPMPVGKATIPKSTIDIAPFCQQVRQILRDGVRYLEDGYEDESINEELQNLVQIAVDYCERGEGHNAIAILEAITATCVEKWDEVAEYGAENEQIVQELNYAWSEAILSTELHPEEKVEIQVNLETWQNEWDADFSMSLEALYQDWDEPGLIQVLMGNVTPRGIWMGEVPEFADDLALVRLKILDRQERYQEYLYLAEAEGQVQHYLSMLGRLGKVEEAMQAAQTQMQTMEQAFALAKTLAEQGKLNQALEIAKTGLDLPGNCEFQLATWTSELADKLGDKQANLLATKMILKVQPSLADYQKIKHLAGEDWEKMKSDLIKILHNYGGWGTESAKVDIFLSEGLIDDAIKIVKELDAYHSDLIHRVMTAAIPHNPGWVIANARRRADLIMDASKAQYYSDAVDWLKQARAAYLASGREADWVKYREKLKQVHGRKRKLMGLLKEQGLD
ncbi:SWIM zinc finger domain-containing protein [Sphaerospermopsis aphanizomenoides BCCUSP55]|uniref:SWIM zinc finger family protein n=1 Tax=Sphaerospermopsis aphanizomenoides TaxID=459663 RepID=UPI001907BE0B|nr:SWIM zinc finger family protein [Sphaerospermopsis aphanizomenoides]MBK1990669.1 SWIM zinc finger domain-containing protein [Sphaerospermopsis aphanizomenoides BCCUSP55]